MTPLHSITSILFTILGKPRQEDLFDELLEEIEETNEVHKVHTMKKILKPDIQNEEEIPLFPTQREKINALDDQPEASLFRKIYEKATTFLNNTLSFFLRNTIPNMKRLVFFRTRNAASNEKVTPQTAPLINILSEEKKKGTPEKLAKPKTILPEPKDEVSTPLSPPLKTLTEVKKEEIPAPLTKSEEILPESKVEVSTLTHTPVKVLPGAKKKVKFADTDKPKENLPEPKVEVSASIPPPAKTLPEVKKEETPAPLAKPKENLSEPKVEVFTSMPTPVNILPGAKKKVKFADADKPKENLPEPKVEVPTSIATPAKTLPEVKKEETPAPLAKPTESSPVLEVEVPAHLSTLAKALPEVKKEETPAPLAKPTESSPAPEVEVPAPLSTLAKTLPEVKKEETPAPLAKPTESLPAPEFGELPPVPSRVKIFFEDKKKETSLTNAKSSESSPTLKVGGPLPVHTPITPLSEGKKKERLPSHNKSSENLAPFSPTTRPPGPLPTTNPKEKKRTLSLANFKGVRLSKIKNRKQKKLSPAARKLIAFFDQSGFTKKQGIFRESARDKTIESFYKYSLKPKNDLISSVTLKGIKVEIDEILAANCLKKIYREINIFGNPALRHKLIELGAGISEKTLDEKNAISDLQELVKQLETDRQEDLKLFIEILKKTHDEKATSLMPAHNLAAALADTLSTPPASKETHLVSLTKEEMRACYADTTHITAATEFLILHYDEIFHK